jgi:hypothetical protein
MTSDGALSLGRRTLPGAIGVVVTSVMVFLLIADRCVLFLDEQPSDAPSGIWPSERQAAVNRASILLG